MIQVVDTAADNHGGNSDRGSVSECRTTKSNHYEATQTGCHAYASVVVLAMGFYFDRVVNPGVPGRITKYYGYHHRATISTMTNHRLERFSDQSVRYSADWNLVNQYFPVGTTTWVQVTLGNGYAASVTNYL